MLLLIVSPSIQLHVVQYFLSVMNQREVTEEELSLANKLKSEGNQLMKDKKFEGQFYSQGRYKNGLFFRCYRKVLRSH